MQSSTCDRLAKSALNPCWLPSKKYTFMGHTVSGFHVACFRAEITPDFYRCWLFVQNINVIWQSKTTKCFRSTWNHFSYPQIIIFCFLLSNRLIKNSSLNSVNFSAKNDVMLNIEDGGFKNIAEATVRHNISLFKMNLVPKFWYVYFWVVQLAKSERSRCKWSHAWVCLF